MKSSLFLLQLILALHPFESASQSLFQRVTNFAKEQFAADLLEGIPSRKLSNGVNFPLIGLGVGNMLMGLIPTMVSRSIQPDRKVYLFDTSNISHNELYVAKGIIEGAEILERDSGIDKVEVHVITKVWYTHLGYERTMYAVNSSLKVMEEAIEHNNIDFKLHVMIHWPRCYDNIPWMECELEEKELPDEVKELGPPPHLDKENAWKESWKALEGLLNDSNNVVSSIGVSNFHLKELEALEKISTVKPHILETDAWSLLYNPMLIDFCHQHDIHVTAHNMMDGVLMKAEQAPFAYNHLLLVANDLTKTMQGSGDVDVNSNEEVTPAQVILAWMVQHSVSVIPRTVNFRHLDENSSLKLGSIPQLTDRQVQTVSLAVEALISEEDLPEDAYIKITFHAKSRDIYLWWFDTEYGGEIQVAKIDQGTSWDESSHPGHVYRVYDSPEKNNYELFAVSGRYGDDISVEL
jgi:diketogulonate reductase-like aldo/keto reductase